MRIALCSLALVIGMSAAILAQEKPPATIDGIRLRLEMTGGKEEEKMPQVLRGILKNESKEPIEVPAAYDGHTIQFYASTANLRWPMRLWRRERLEIAMIKVAPGEERVLFEFPITEMINGRLDGKALNAGYGWDWSGRPAPPASPFVSRDGATPSELTFWFLVQVDKKSASSPHLKLKWGSVFSVVP